MGSGSGSGVRPGEAARHLVGVRVGNRVRGVRLRLRLGLRLRPRLRLRLGLRLRLRLGLRVRLRLGLRVRRGTVLSGAMAIAVITESPD